ncbi:putative cytochrome p450 protein [Neofusicoccum parvum]|uniref:Cytochrome p450 protein n=1 Tax=Neofusicoccum parvum TaxID=310453 RepID=A0ACB5SAP0_9PEZI|nr:putative cytochrome p450 protein [Neofusicoccum parvum]
MTTVNVFLLGLGESSAQPFQLGAFKSLDDLLAAVVKRFNILAEKADTALYQGSKKLQHLQEIKDGPLGVAIGGHGVRDPQGPAGIPFFGNYFDIYPDHVGNYRRLFETYGGVIKVHNNGRTFYLTNDPEVARLVFRDGDYFTKAPSSPGHPLHGIEDPSALFLCDTEAPAWKEAHKFLPPSMSPKAMRHHLPIITAAVTASFNVLDQTEDLGQAFNVFKYAGKLASQVSAKMVLGVDLHQFDCVDSPLHRMMALVERAVLLNTRLQVRGKLYSYLPFGDPAQLRQSLKEVYGYIDQAILDCDRDNVTDLPLQAAAVESTCLVDYMLRATDGSGKKMTSRNVRGNVLVLLGAGFITSSAFLSWLIYSLVAYQGMQERLLLELVDHGAAPGKQWTYEEIHALPFLDAFVKETQRVHSPSFQPARNTRQDVVLPGGYRLPKGAVIIPSLPHLHTNPDHWSDPYRFDPDRWSTDRVRGRHRSAYVPFAAGARGCIGFNAALLEAKVAVAELVYRYAFFDASEAAIEYDPEFNNIRPSNFYAKVVRRTSWPAPSALGMSV